MRILSRNFKKGMVKLVPKTLDDLWHLYNIIYSGDTVYARTTREIKVKSEYSRPQKGKRVSVFLGVEAKEIAWDRSLNRLRVHGKILEAPEDVVGRGTYHTLNLAVNKPITIVKKEWLKHQIDRLEQINRLFVQPVVVVSIDSEEFCIAMIRQYGIEKKVGGHARLPGKLEAEKRTDALNSYFKRTSQALRSMWENNHCPVAIIGAGYLKNRFAKYVKEKYPQISSDVVAVKGVNNSGIAGIQEALRSGVLDTVLKHLRVANEVTLVEEVLARLGKGIKDVTYGLAQVEKAESYGAVETLLVADSILRESTNEERLTLEGLIRRVEEKRGKVVIISVEHEAGQKLLALGGVAALLRFPID